MNSKRQCDLRWHPPTLHCKDSAPAPQSRTSSYLKAIAACSYYLCLPSRKTAMVQRPPSSKLQSWVSSQIPCLYSVNLKESCGQSGRASSQVQTTGTSPWWQEGRSQDGAETSVLGNAELLRGRSRTDALVGGLQFWWCSPQGEIVHWNQWLHSPISLPWQRQKTFTMLCWMVYSSGEMQFSKAWQKNGQSRSYLGAPFRS